MKLVTILGITLLIASPMVAADFSFNRDIRPILAENCFYCHGQDPNKRKGGLRLDVREETVKPMESGEAAIVPGDAARSALVSRIFASDPDEQMPPSKSNRMLTQQQKDNLKRWISEGAKYEAHWAFTAPVKATLPVVKKTGWTRRDLDRFVLAKLEANGLQPAPEAEREVLLRRLSLDLIGLPPTPAEVDAFVADTAPDAYEKVVERLLQSQHYGERMVLPWLDAARYADSNGFQQDGDTFQWVWRDWVVRALNADMPFDQFSIEQLAGDLLPKPTTDQLVATAFNRNHLLNGEGGAIAEEQRFNILFDRVDTTATTWLGLTIACAQCHDHKYDPLTQRDYYGLLAMFNNVPERGVPGGSGQYRVAEPSIPVGSEEKLARLKELEAANASAKAAENEVSNSKETKAAYEATEKNLTSQSVVEWTALRPSAAVSTGELKLNVLDDLSIFAEGKAPDKGDYTITLPASIAGLTGFRIETIPDRRLPQKGAGHGDSGNAVLTGLKLKVGNRVVRFTAAAATYSQAGFSPAGVIDDDSNTGWAFYPETNKPYVLTVQTAEPVTASAGEEMVLTFEFQSANKQHLLGRFRISGTSATLPATRTALPDDISAILKKGERTKEDAAKLRDYVTKNSAPLAVTRTRDAAKAAEKALNDFRTTLPRVMIMSDSQPRQTKLLSRGDYLNPTVDVTANSPAFLPRLPEGSPNNRLGFAKWLFQPAHPLTARVQVNRLWQHFFGTGIVKTVEDLGVQSEVPVHQELLDWLAVEFREQGWSQKHMVRLIVNSATYRQSSRVSREALQRDPENRLMSRGARFRAPAMILRDVALAASGMLETRVGGPPVYPYQPDAIWESLAITKERDFTYPASSGRDLYRRSLYTFWRRTVGPANMFDASNRQVCKVRQNITNTPLHALTTLNDPTWAEAARVLAARSMESATETEARLTFALRSVLGRKPTARDLSALSKAFDRQLAIYKDDPKAAAEVVAIGTAPKNEKLDTAEHAALTAVCLAIFNLDEALTRE
ncbi:MAG: PSD1 and planctomycete cytochrome C domain-containing protein [Prosthecobacter sp.]|uniref:PSD1 and planctomycete cytochrome C domain-containing protein n=1 Tax=Prosthecobacter sp. TaxID=1965333 RepID=UPI0038FF0F85